MPMTAIFGHRIRALLYASGAAGAVITVYLLINLFLRCISKPCARLMIGWWHSPVQREGGGECGDLPYLEAMTTTKWL